MALKRIENIHGIRRWGGAVASAAASIAAAAIFLAPPTRGADLVFPAGTAISVSRVPDSLSLVPNTEINVLVTIANNTAASLRGIYYAEHIPAVFDVQPGDVLNGGVPVLDYSFEVSGDDTYPHTLTYRWILEEPGAYGQADNAVLPGDILTISYRLTTSGYYFSEWPPYILVAESELPVPEYCHGYCEETLFINEDDDADGMADVWEIEYFLDLSHDGTADGDFDGLTDLEEYQSGTDPAAADSDLDGLSDGDEVNVHGTNPVIADTDGEGLSDGDEVNIYGTDPVSADTDGEGLTDYDEAINCGTDPNDPDSDDDHVNDFDEVGYDGAPGYDPYDPDTNPTGTDLDASAADTDGDGLSDYIEFESGSDGTDQTDLPARIWVSFGPEGAACPPGLCAAGPGSYDLRGYGWR